MMSAKMTDAGHAAGAAEGAPPTAARAPLGARRVRDLLNDLGVHPSKRLGQHFLCDPRAAAAVLEAARLGPHDAVLEVGPGLGALTYGLVAVAGAVVAVEVDARLAAALDAATRDLPNVRVVHGDALRADLGGLLDGARPLAAGPRRLVSSLPYCIVGPLMARLLDPDLALERLVVVVQREVVDRIVAHPGTKTYGQLSVLAQYHAQPRIVARLPAAAFWPPPEVASSIVCLDRRAAPPVDVPAGRFMTVVAAALNQRRKMLLNALAASSRLREACGCDRAGVAAALAAAGIDPRRRGETLSLEEFGRVAAALFQQGGRSCGPQKLAPPCRR